MRGRTRTPDNLSLWPTELLAPPDDYPARTTPASIRSGGRDTSRSPADFVKWGPSSFPVLRACLDKSRNRSCVQPLHHSAPWLRSPESNWRLQVMGLSRYLFSTPRFISHQRIAAISFDGLKKPMFFII